jgi:hypothetical protein
MVPTVTAWLPSDATSPASAARQRQLAWPQCAFEGRSVFTGISPLARKAEAHPRNVAGNDGDLTRNGEVWGPDPWRPHPV